MVPTRRGEPDPPLGMLPLYPAPTGAAGLPVPRQSQAAPSQPPPPPPPPPSQLRPVPPHSQSQQPQQPHLHSQANAHHHHPLSFLPPPQSATLPNAPTAPSSESSGGAGTNGVCTEVSSVACTSVQGTNRIDEDHQHAVPATSLPLPSIGSSPIGGSIGSGAVNGGLNGGRASLDTAYGPPVAGGTVGFESMCGAYAPPSDASQPSSALAAAHVQASDALLPNLQAPPSSLPFALCVAAAAQPNMTADLPMSTTSCDPGGTVQGATDEASQAASAGRGGKGRGGTDGRGGRGGRGCHSVPSSPPESLPGDGELSMIDLNLEQRPPLPVKPPAAAPISFAAAAAAAASRPMPLSAQPNAAAACRKVESKGSSGKGSISSKGGRGAGKEEGKGSGRGKVIDD